MITGDFSTIGNSLQTLQSRLEQAGIDNARFEARLLLCHVLNIETQILIAYPERALSPLQQETLIAALARRENREPMSHILGEREFWSLPFKVTADTLTPRPDSETLIEAALRHFPDTEADLQVLDLGVGTGCLLLSVLSEFPNAFGLGVDISAKALDVARENAERLELAGRSQWELGNWADGIDQTFDLVLSNPPYISENDKDSLEPEVAHFEPDSALFAGADGLDDYRLLAQVLGRLLKDDGRAILEIGIGQAQAVSELMENADLEVLETPKDLGGVTRCVIIRKKL